MTMTTTAGYSAPAKRVRTRAVAVLSAIALALGFLVTNPSSAHAAGWPVISSGASGDDVTTAQYLLRASGQSLDADGQFGPGTAAAVSAFQTANALTADGVIGAATWPKLAVVVQSGDTGDAVKGLQTQLNANGASVAVDGVFGAGTAAAVQGFQSSAGLTVDGVVGPATWEALLGGGGATTPPPTGDAAAVAQQILDNPSIELYELGTDAASTSLANIRDTAAGKPALTSPESQIGVTSVNLNPAMLTGLLALQTQYGYDLRVTSIAGELHGDGSAHYEGSAVDIDRIDGVTVINGAAHQAVQDACVALGASLTLGPGDADHSDHVHCQW